MRIQLLSVTTVVKKLQYNNQGYFYVVVVRGCTMVTKARGGKVEHLSKTGARGKKTSQGNHRNLGFSTMNKNKRRSFKSYRGQGR